MTESSRALRSLRDGTRPHAILAAVLWTLAVLAVLGSGALAAMTALMPVSIDWGEAITAGTDPWVGAFVAIGEFLGVAAASVLGMGLWHTRRFKLVAIGLVAVATATTLWLGVRFAGEYL